MTSAEEVERIASELDGWLLFRQANTIRTLLRERDEARSLLREAEKALEPYALELKAANDAKAAHEDHPAFLTAHTRFDWILTPSAPQQRHTTRSKE